MVVPLKQRHDHISSMHFQGFLTMYIHHLQGYQDQFSRLHSASREVYTLVSKRFQICFQDTSALGEVELGKIIEVYGFEKSSR